MPIYEYECVSCQFRFELMQRISDPKPSQCPKCEHAEVKKLISKVGFQLKGTGWYETDFKNNGKESRDNSKDKSPSGAESTEKGKETTKDKGSSGAESTEKGKETTKDKVTEKK